MKMDEIIRGAVERYNFGKKLVIASTLITPKIGESATDVVNRFEEAVMKGEIRERSHGKKEKVPA